MCLYYGTGKDPSLTAAASFPIAYFPFSDYWVSGTSTIGGLFGGGGLRAFGEMSVCKLLAPFAARGEAG